MVRLKQIRHYLGAETLNNALSFLAEKGGKAMVIAGGTSLAFIQPQARIDTLLDITPLRLNHISQRKNFLSLGSTLTVNELAESVAAKNLFNSILRKAALSTAANTTRNLITLGGNMVSLFSWSIFPVVFWALDVQIVINTVSGEQILKADSLFSRHPQKSIMSSEIITELRLPLPEDKKEAGIYRFKKFSRTATEFSWLSLATKIIFARDSWKIKDARIVVGALSPLPQRLTETEDLLRGNLLGGELIAKALKKACEEARITRDLRCSVDYKREILKVFLGEVLEQIILEREKEGK